MLKAACSLICLLGAAAGSRADEVDYLRDVKPILARRCYACHGPLKQQQDLRLDSAAAMAKGGESGPALVHGKSQESLILTAVRGTDGWRMPPEGDPLSDEEIAVLAAWIDAGAVAPDEPLADPSEHWAYRPPVRPALPEAAGEGGNPVDAFVNAQHASRGLQPLPRADKNVLLRRLYLDLIGLPPARAELAAFVSDDSADAYQKVVDRLLADPRYGQRWGRHWMDVWRYADWAGFGNEIRDSQRHIWRWRDWIVESLNADRGYDRLIMEMLAGDELAPADPDTLRATGFLARNWFSFNRNVWLDNTVEHTAKAFLGLTLNCARCHDHMYDPVAQQDYYRFRAFFEPYEVRTDRVPGQSDLMKDGVARVYDAKAEAPTYLFVRGNEAEPDTEHPLAPGLPAILAPGELAIEPVPLPPRAYNPGLHAFVQDEALAQARAAVAQANDGLAKAQQAVAAARERVARLSAPASQPDEPAVQAFISDRFSEANPAVWQTVDGQWSYESGRLVQQQTGSQECRLLSLAEHPADFSASFAFKITGGQQWRSVGLSFDATEDGRFNAVYLSAVAGGSKLQVYYNQGAPAYPADAMKTLAVQLNRDYLLKVDVRGQLLNVWLDGVLELVYRLPHPRRPGRLALWTFDAMAEFVSVDVAALSPDAVLAESATDQPVANTLEAARQAEQNAQAASAVAEAAVAAAAAGLRSVEARVAADRSRFSDPPAADAESLARAAGRAEREATVAAARHKLLVEEQAAELARQAVAAAGEKADEKTRQTLTAAEAKAAEAGKALEAAEAALAAADSNTGSSYAPLDELYPSTSTGRRLALARWIADPANPLTARVAVNQIWLRHFGEPLVPTVFDFGLNGQPPTHPELLDWLAVELMEQGWKMKAIHRLIVTSDAYCRSSSPASHDDSNLAIDPDNRTLWRTRPRRMEAEVVRDSVLHVAGQLDATMGGPDIDHKAGETSRRRSLYFQHANEKQMVLLKLFDAASVNECYRRDESIVPQQALALANSGLSLSQARLLAGQLSSAGTLPDEDFISAAFEQVLCRGPSAAERGECLRFLAGQARLLEDKEKLTGFAGGSPAEVPPSADPAQRARENLVHVLLNHNDFVTIR
ncbi:MAG: PSD1 and planctomycete cytochrome C domain-containing protein [Pirellulales bacterium]